MNIYVKKTAVLNTRVTMTIVSDVENSKNQRIILSHVNFLSYHYNIFRGFRSTGSPKSPFPVDFAEHHYNIDAATMQPILRA